MLERTPEVKRGRGRPTDSPKTTQIVARFDKDTLKILDDFCREKSIGHAEAVRQAVRALKNEKK